MNNNLTDVTIILDRSGSMIDIASDMIGAVNTFFDGQRNLPGDLNVTLVQFDSQNPYEVIHNVVPIDKVPNLTEKTFIPRGNTPLLQAIGTGIVNTGIRLAALRESDRPGKVLFIIVTDGQENTPMDYTREMINEMITRQQKEYSWQFMFLGSNQDAIAVAKSYGILRSNSLTYYSNTASVDAVACSLNSSVKGYRSTGNLSFTEEDRKTQEKVSK